MPTLIPPPPPLPPQPLSLTAGRGAQTRRALNIRSSTPYPYGASFFPALATLLVSFQQLFADSCAQLPPSFFGPPNIHTPRRRLMQRNVIPEDPTGPGKTHSLAFCSFFATNQMGIRLAPIHIRPRPLAPPLATSRWRGKMSIAIQQPSLVK